MERFNHTLKTMLCKHASEIGVQWNTYLSGVLFANRNTPLSSTGEKPLFLLYGFDCRYPMQAATLPVKPLNVRNLAEKSITRAQQHQE